MQLNKIGILFVFLAWFLLSCQTRSEIILFEGLYSNEAWGNVVQGVFIDMDGSIFEYHHDNTRSVLDKSSTYTYSQVLSQYGYSLQRIGKVEPEVKPQKTMEK